MNLKNNNLPGRHFCTGIKPSDILLLTTLCIVSAFFRVSFSEPISRSGFKLTPDSSEYHFLAVNLLNREGYIGFPISGVEYDDYSSSIAVGKIKPAEVPSCSRTPGYPLFLAFVYWAHGVDPEVVHTYQLILAAVTAGLLPFCGFIIGRQHGAIGGTVAAYLLANYPGAQYAASQMLSECLSECLLTVCFCVAIATQKVSFRRALILGILLGMAVLARPGNIFVAIFSILLCSVISLRRGAACMIGCIVIVGAWSSWASVNSNHFIALSGNSTPVLVAGIDPNLAATKRGLSQPSLDMESLEVFWKNWPGDGNATLKEYVLSATKSPSHFVKVQMIKMKIGLHSIPSGALALMFLGSLGFIMNSKTIKRNKNVRGFLTTLIAILFIVTVVQPRELVLFLYLLIFTASVAGLFIKEYKTNGDGISQLFDNSYSIMWSAVFLWGYIAMIIISIAHDRFARPFLPVFFFSACLSLFYLRDLFISKSSSEA